MTLFISVVNHNHDNMIINNSTLQSLASEYTVIIKSNTKPSKELTGYCKSFGILLIEGVVRKGFGENNNEVFDYVVRNFGLQSTDYFLVLNPDIEITLSTVKNLMFKVIKDNTLISTINLYKDRNFKQHDYSIRYFPSLLNPLKSLLKIKRSDFYDKSQVFSPTIVDWAAGSFLLFRNDLYKNLNGFDEKYFMYFEDVDICRRAKELNINVVYYPQFKAVHFAQHSNKSLFSKEQFYYIRSTYRYFFSN
ncbi:Rhamnosyltransferase WbbL [Vibrio thalassae]|uniref:Rhamnosyltransferase WbbL n=1 Tax=Vibrio thalassae TaxID=1243014 RepID=A0A240ENE6_9VIBR|nr:glycosyltransferase [Vibrio thalassae]SNX49773.1 Rhamnosyltransferase WbbL [Vibrio thalassae]